MKITINFNLDSLAPIARVLGAAALACVPAHAQNVWFVNTSGGGNGASWSSPTTLDNALALAVTGDEIRCKEGVYTPSVMSSSPDRRSATFTVQSGVRLRGGYLGSETGGRPLGNVLGSILDGNVQDPLSGLDNAYHVLTVTATDPVTISRFEIRNGYAVPTPAPITPSSDTRNKGAGIYAPLGAQLTLAHLHVHENDAADRGGALFLSNGNAVMKQCTIDHNTAVYGGGLFSGFSHVDAVNVRFSVNGLPGGGLQGGAVYLRSNSSTFTNCTFEGNLVESPTGASGGAAFLIGGHTTVMTNCTFFQNYSGYGGVHTLDNTNNQSGGVVTLQNSIVWTDNWPAAGTHFSGDALPPFSNTNFLVQFSDVQMAGGGLYPDLVNAPANTNFNAEPSFTLPEVSLRSATSPFLNAGSNALLNALTDIADIDDDGVFNEPLPLDRERFVRVQGGTVALGAIEQADAAYVLP